MYLYRRGTASIGLGGFHRDAMKGTVAVEDIRPPDEGRSC